MTAEWAKPECCERSKSENYLGDPNIVFTVSPEDETYRGWAIFGTHTFINFCPFCGKKFPEMEKTKDLEVCKVTDGGYYCDTCKQRLMCCECPDPGVQWTPVKV